MFAFAILATGLINASSALVHREKSASPWAGDPGPTGRPLDTAEESEAGAYFAGADISTDSMDKGKSCAETATAKGGDTKAEVFQWPARTLCIYTYSQ